MRSVLVHVDGGPRSAVRMRVAARLAHEEGLQLTALFAAAPRHGAGTPPSRRAHRGRPRAGPTPPLPARRPVGERLLARAGEVEADLLVMGCYGRPRSVEWMLGGATRTVLGRMALPVLMCH